MARIENGCEALRAELLAALEAAADPERAAGQQAYMKSAMPYLGVTVPAVRKIARAAFRRHPFEHADGWQRCVLTLWRDAAHREVRYAAVELLLLAAYRPWITLERVPLLRELIQTGAWWDYVDAIAANAVGHVLAEQPARGTVMLRRWAVDDDIWLRRSAILAQLKFKDRTDFELLCGCIEPSLGETEFFLRKAIGWALREYSKTDPAAVLRYVDANDDRLSNLSRREALKVIDKRAAQR